MPLETGARLGAYEIVSAIGAGGMGEVYRARDTKLNRDVALKVLPDSFALDPDRLARFRREAQVLASLNHSNIAQIYGLEGQDGREGQAGGALAIAMELVEGPTLAEMIAGSRLQASGSGSAATPKAQSLEPRAKALPISEALHIAKQIAEALEAAHEQGIIHRDLKPANIKVRDDGTVKVLDFGLAKALEPASGSGLQTSGGMTQSPTITSPAMMTGIGVILGTAAYMSPEQAKGRPADKRSDVWAFGCVLYEMLAGTRPFDAEDLSTTLAAVIMKEPDWTALPSSLPPAIRTLVQRCLEKDRRQRIADVSVARFVFAEHANLGNIADPGNPANLGNPPWWRRPLPWAVATLLFAGIAAIATFIDLHERRPAAPAEMRVDIVTPTTSDPASFALSPDGRQLAFVASPEGGSRLWLRPLGGGSTKPLPGTEGATLPFWSPDSRSLGFLADSKIKRIDIDTGRVRTLTNIRAPRGASWNTQGDILFSLGGVYPLYRVPASGGEPVAVTKQDPQQTGHVYPRFLPDGRRFLFLVTAPTDDLQGIYLGSLDSPDVKRVTGADTPGAFLAPDWLVFMRQTTLFACRFDLNRGVLLGEPVAIADPVVSDNNTGAFSVSSDGLLAYRSGSASVRQLTWFDRSGRALGTFGTPDFSDPEISPDGKRVAVARTVQGNLDVWLVDSVRETKFTFDPSNETLPLWSPDGARIAFRSNQKGTNNIYEKAAGGVGPESPLVESSQLKNLADWSPDGRFLMYYSDSGGSNRDIWVLPVGGDRKPFVWLATPFNETDAQFSPDGRWIAYESDQSGSGEIYISPFVPPTPGSAITRAPSSPAAQFQVSTAGSKSPRWRPDGKELFYIAPSGMLMAAPVVVRGGTIESGVPLALFDPRITSVGNNKQQYDVAPDGRFLINVRTEDATTALITLLVNWKPPSR